MMGKIRKQLSGSWHASQLRLVFTGKVFPVICICAKDAVVGDGRIDADGSWAIFKWMHVLPVYIEAKTSSHMATTASFPVTLHLLWNKLLFDALQFEC